MTLKSTMISVALLLCLVGTGISLHKEKQAVICRDKQIQVLKDRETQAKKDEDTQKTTIRDLQKKLESKPIPTTNDSKDAAYQAFQKTTEKVFKGLFEFTPETYKNRQSVIGAGLSEKLTEQYFGKKGYYGDGNNATSKLDSLRIYNRTLQKDSLDGIVVVAYESKIGNNDFKKATELYEVSFDVASGKLQEITNLGNHLGSENLD